VNTRSLRFRLIVWYATLLAGCFIVLGSAAYVALDIYLTRALSAALQRRGRQIEQLLAQEIRRNNFDGFGAEIDSRYAPSVNERFVRVSTATGNIVFQSATPPTLKFFPERIPSAGMPSRPNSTTKFTQDTGLQLLIVRHVADLPGNGKYLIETGAPLDDVQADLRQWLLILLVGLPVFVLVSVIGGYVLIQRALAPVDQITASAERITSRNLSERLPVAKTADEIERLSTALNLMIGRLEDAFQNSRRFMADASHELRTPLTVLRGEMEGLTTENLAPELQQRLGSALEELERLINIVEGLLALSRLDAGEAQSEWVKFDLTALTASTADQMSLLAEDKRINITCAPSKDVWVEGDRARIKQVVVNLLDNAIKYTLPGGSVGLSVSTRQGKALLEVADNGIGIPSDALPKVFDRFYRVDDARTRDLGGAGLGLSIVRAICAAHHGRVEVSSKPGQGTTFRLELPLANRSNGARETHGNEFARTTNQPNSDSLPKHEFTKTHVH
jgi:heavy metal sensor kinase